MNAEYYRNLYEATPAIQMTVDAAGVILLASRWAVDHLTHGEESLINQCLWSWVVPADREDGEQVFAALWQGEGDRRVWYGRLQPRRTPPFWVKMTASRVPSEGGEVLSVVCDRLSWILPGEREPDRREAELVALNETLFRKLYEEEQRQRDLQDSEEKFRQLAENICEVFWVATPAADQILYISPMYEQVWGRSREDLYVNPQAWIESIHPDDRLRVAQAFRERAECGKAFEQEYRVVRPDGAIRWVRARDFSIYDERGELYRIVGIGEDVTERKLAEAAAKRQLERERLMGAIARYMCQTLDLGDVLAMVADEVRRFLEVERVVVYRLPREGPGAIAAQSSLMVPLREPLALSRAERALYVLGSVQRVENAQTEKARVSEARRLRRWQVGAELVVPLRQEGALWGVILVHSCLPRSWLPSEVDLLEQVAAQVAVAIQQASLYQQVQALNLSLEQQIWERTVLLKQALAAEAMFKRITERMRDSLDEMQILHTVVQELRSLPEVDYCCVALFGEEVARAAIAAEAGRSLLPALQGVLTSREFAVAHEQLHRGERFQTCLWVEAPLNDWATIAACPILDNHHVLGTVLLLVGKNTSLSESRLELVQQVANQCAIALRQARLYQTAQMQVEELERLNVLKDDFLSTVSHELRTPVASIKMATQMLEVTLQQTQILQTTSAGRYLAILRAECDREIGLIDDLLDLSRLEVRPEALTLTTLNLAEWLPPIVETFQERSRDRALTLRLELDPALPSVVSDGDRLERILRELLNNACKYTPAPGEILVTAQATPENVFIQIKNTGADIPPVELSRMFDKFYRIPVGDRWKYSGTGLGLALVKKLVSYLGGAITVTSAEGWITFTVQLVR